ncbi:MAG: phosphotransferase [Thermomicrobiales bacterium]
MRPFAFLTTQGRARRMRPLALAALEHYPLEVERLRLVNNETNCTFRVDATGGETYALRISLPDVHSVDEIEAEIEWQLAISRETDIPVSRPIATRRGDYVVTAGARGVPEERHCVLFSWLGGRTLADVASPETFHSFGALSARLHRHGATFQPARPDVIHTLDMLYPLGDREMILDDSTRVLFPKPAYDTLLDMRAAVNREIGWMFGRGESPALLHGDLHWWNVMSYRGRLQVIDFEDLAWGFPVQDIAVTLYYAARNDDFAELREAFRAGYETITPWPEMYPGQTDLLMVHRALDLFNFVLGSTLREDRELLDEFVENIQGHHREVFESWQSRFSESVYR